MDDLDDLRAQRDALSRRITEAESAAADECEGRLDQMHDALLQVAYDYGITADESTRKNVNSVSLGTVTVELGYPRGEYKASLWVRYDGGAADLGSYGKALPPVEALIGFVRGLLDKETSQ